MIVENFINVLYNKNSLLVLSYISKNVFEENTATSISRNLNLAVSSVHSILKIFEQTGIVKSRVIGKSVIYEIDKQNPIFKTFRTFDNISNILPMVERLKPLSRKVILFGSCSRGDDTINSDIDLFVLTDNGNKDKINNIIEDAGYKRQVNPVIIDTIEVMQLEKDDKTFYNEINKGIVLWEE